PPRRAAARPPRTKTRRQQIQSIPRAAATDKDPRDGGDATSATRRDAPWHRAPLPAIRPTATRARRTARTPARRPGAIPSGHGGAYGGPRQPALGHPGGRAGTPAAPSAARKRRHRPGTRPAAWSWPAPTIWPHGSRARRRPAPATTAFPGPGSPIPARCAIRAALPRARRAARVSARRSLDHQHAALRGGEELRLIHRLHVRRAHPESARVYHLQEIERGPLPFPEVIDEQRHVVVVNFPPAVQIVPPCRFFLQRVQIVALQPLGSRWDGILNRQVIPIVSAERQAHGNHVAD